MQSPNTVVVSPHPDDAVLSCWRLLTRPATRRVVTVFAGLPDAGVTPSAWDRLTRCADPRERARQRRVEDRGALEPTGCTPVHLDFVGAVHRGAALDGAALAAVLRAAIGDADTVCGPAGIGGHPDHVATRDALLAVSTGRRRLLYADQPYAARFGWPAWVTGLPPAVDLDVEGWFAAQLRTVPGVPERARIHRLSGPLWAAKVEAIKQYRSQFPALAASAGADFPDGPRWAYEVVWQLS